jgi:hypothetical protein
VQLRKRLCQDQSLNISSLLDVDSALHCQLATRHLKCVMAQPSQCYCLCADCLSVVSVYPQVRLDQGTCQFLAAFLVPPAADEAPVLVSAPGASDDDEDAAAAAAADAADSSTGAFPRLDRRVALPQDVAPCTAVGSAMTAMRTSIASHAVTAQTYSQSGHAAGTPNPSHCACCAAGPFFSSVAVSGWGVVVDYRPRRVDLGALRSGALTEARSE